MTPRRYTEKESAEIMRKAAESQAASASSTGHGVTEAELRSAAKELGIEPSAMDAALMAVDSDLKPGRKSLWGGPFQHESEAIFDGDLSEELWEDVLSDLRRTFGEPGAVEQRGSTKEWVGTGGGLVTNTVTLRQAGKSVRVKAMADWSGASVLAYIMLIFPVFITAGLMTKLAVGRVEAILIALALVGAYFLGVRFWLGASARKTARNMNQLVRRVQSLLSSPGEAQAKPLETTSTESADSVDVNVG